LIQVQWIVLITDFTIEVSTLFENGLDYVYFISLTGLGFVLNSLKMAESQKNSASESFFWAEPLASMCKRQRKRYTASGMPKPRQLELLAPYSRCQAVVKDRHEDASRSGNRRVHGGAPETAACGCDGYKPKDTTVLLDNMDSDNVAGDSQESCKKCNHTKREDPFTLVTIRFS
jgi:hypothetical protein